MKDSTDKGKNFLVSEELIRCSSFTPQLGSENPFQD